MTILIIIAIFAVIVIFASSLAKNHEQVQTELASKMYGEKKDSLIEDLASDTERMRQLTEAMIQAGIVGDTLTISAIEAGTYSGPLPERRNDGGYLSIFDNLRILKVAGMNFRQGMNRYKGFIDAALVPEPKNEYDKNAIKIVAVDGHHLGYVPAEQTDFVRSLTANEFPYKCKCEVCEGIDDDDEKYYFGYVYIKRLD